jgi:hypothetical protein
VTESLGEELRVLCEQLLTTADQEEQALAAGDLGQLEACVGRREEIARQFREVECEENRTEPSPYGDEVARLLEQATRRHQRVRRRVEMMLDECTQALLEMRIEVRARQAYYRARNKGCERSAHLL